MPVAPAQDTQQIASPDGNVQFRIFISKPPDAILFRLAYQISYHGKPLIEPSFLGIDILDQEPILGENMGLIRHAESSHPQYNSLVARYMQNGSLGRLLEVEVRVANDGVAFRYRIPVSQPLLEILVADEATEFSFPPGVKAGGPADSTAKIPLPYAVAAAGTWVGISEAQVPGFPHAYLAPLETGTVVTRLTAPKPAARALFEGVSPLTCPWRVIAIAGSAERLKEASILRFLN